MERCDWCKSEDIYVQYHDEEWGVPVHDDQVHFEFLVLESAQSGLSWITILKKRENYRKAYDGFDPIKVAQYGEKKVNELLSNPGIIRNRSKIESSINNAKRFIEIQKEFGSFDRYIWSFVDHKPVVNRYEKVSEIPATSALSDQISKDLKKRGFKFLGSITIYSYLQAVGIVDDHINACCKKSLNYQHLQSLEDWTKENANMK
ncbi:MAG: DNA-3-methyladenine glycosylase I [Clostridia bacterium]|nr:DNA-3-methyladenine glycosylase I [Clostridia bacterium]